MGSGPESADLASLRVLAGVTVENRWVPEGEIGALFAWADVLVLPYREASQSGVAPAAIAAGRFVVSTRVGGLVEQLGNEQLATLCEPNAASLAAGLRSVLDASAIPRPSPVPTDPCLAWRDMAERLLDRTRSLLLGNGRGVHHSTTSWRSMGGTQRYAPCWQRSHSQSPSLLNADKGRHRRLSLP